jgi:anti-sigma-K factor RskA
MVKLLKNVTAFWLRMCYSVVVAVVVVLAGGAAVQAQEPPPTPTLAPVVSTTTSATQTYQLQEFARSEAYLVDHTTVFTTTVGGATWAIERRFSYGEAGITVVMMALALVETLRLIYQAVNDGRVRW